MFVARGGRSELTTTILPVGLIEDLVERMLASSGRRVDLSQPFVDASLPDGTRLHVTIPDITRRHWAVNVDQPKSTPRLVWRSRTGIRCGVRAHMRTCLVQVAG